MHLTVQIVLSSVFPPPPFTLRQAIRCLFFLHLLLAAGYFFLLSSGAGIVGSVAPFNLCPKRRVCCILVPGFSLLFFVFAFFCSVFSRIWSFWLTGVHRAKKCVYFFPVVDHATGD